MVKAFKPAKTYDTWISKKKVGGSFINKRTKYINNLGKENIIKIEGKFGELHDMYQKIMSFTTSKPEEIEIKNIGDLKLLKYNKVFQEVKVQAIVNGKKETENFVQACMYPPHGYRSFGPVRGFLYGGSDYPKHANDEILKFAMIETKESLGNLDEIMTTPGLSGIYIGPADLSIAIGEEPGFDKPKTTKAYSEICRILETAKKNNIFAAIHNGSTEYALKMIDMGFDLVTVGSDHRSISSGAKIIIDEMKGSSKKESSKTY